MNMRYKKLFRKILIQLIVGAISFCVPFMYVFAAGHNTHYSLTVSSIGHLRQNLHWFYYQQGSRNFATEIRTGTYDWEDADGCDASFERVYYADQAEVQVYSKSYGNIGWTGYHIPSAASYSTIHLNEYYYDSTYPLKFKEVFTHEMGHAFGLGHYDCDNELMRPFNYKFSSNPEEGDIAGYMDKYGL